MKKAGKILGWTFLILILLLGVGITFTIGWRPFVGPRTRPLTDVKFQSTPQRLARGEYLAHITACMECHAPHQWTAHDAPIPPNMVAAGQDMTMLKGLPGRVIAPNISPDPETGAGNWTDDQLARAIREGIGHDGRALFPIMPYPDFRAMTDEDVASIIVYLRSLPPVRQQQRQTQIIFPVNYLIRTVPQPLTAPVPAPDVSTPEKRGKYLVTIIGCTDCHTPQDAQGQPLPGMDFAGGFIMEGPWGRVASSNITPDPSGIPYYDLALFTQVFRTGYVKARPINQIMPWTSFREMTDEDIAAIFSYIKTLKPVMHRVDNTEPPTYCKIDKQMHGGGNQN
ncbi:MAG: c-type cytochrome [Candidatus Acidiferrum sp.]